MNSDDRKILREIRDQNQIILEIVGLTWDKMQTLATKSELRRVADDVAWMKRALKETNRDLKALSRRVTSIQDALQAASVI
jgi:hypothetical protein